MVSPALPRSNCACYNFSILIIPFRILLGFCRFTVLSIHNIVSRLVLCARHTAYKYASIDASLLALNICIDVDVCATNTERATHYTHTHTWSQLKPRTGVEQNGSNWCILFINSMFHKQMPCVHSQRQITLAFGLRHPSVPFQSAAQLQ